MLKNEAKIMKILTPTSKAPLMINFKVFFLLVFAFFKKINCLAYRYKSDKNMDIERKERIHRFIYEKVFFIPLFFSLKFYFFYLLEIVK